MNRQFKKYLLLLLCSALFFPLFLSAQTVRYTKAYGRHYVYLPDVARYYGMKLYRKSRGCELRSRYSRIIFQYQKRSGWINGVKVNFMRAPFVSSGIPFMSEHDFLLLLDPLIRRKAVPARKVTTVMIDPGHGGQDKGASGRLYHEKDIVLKIALRLRAILKGKGYAVIMTRTGDTFPSLKDRTNLCNSRKPDIFISIHCNSASSKTASGIETFCMTPAGEASSSSSVPEKASQKGNRNDKANARLAYEIQKSVVRYTGAADRGIKYARFFVLKNINCPGVLIETGFLSNHSEERKLGTEYYQNAVAKGIANAIANFKAVVR